MLTDQWQGVHHIGDATYVVLRLDRGGDPIHTRAARYAAALYVQETMRAAKSEGVESSPVIDQALGLRILLAKMRKEEKPLREKKNKS
jgi:hypothetical protein